MTTDEFSNQFDVLYNNITSNKAPGLNEYEKSVLLTKSENEIVRDYYNPEGNKYKEGFDDSAKRQSDFAKLITSASLANDSQQVSILDPRSKCFLFPSDTFLIVNEQLQLIKTVDSTDSLAGVRQVVPLKYDEYMLKMSKPFKEPLKWQAWRLISNQSNGSTVAEIITTTADSKIASKYKYILRYIRIPKPIILTDLSEVYGDNLSINGLTAKTECELGEAIHEEILQRAVELAKIAWAGDANQVQAEIAAGQRSE
jgi:hypothetical protein